MCYACKKVGRFAELCRNKIVASVENTDDHFIGTASLSESVGWNTKVKLANTEITFKMDSGVDEACIPEAVYNILKVKTKLLKPKKRLHACDSKGLRICGMFTSEIESKNKIPMLDCDL